MAEDTNDKILFRKTRFPVEQSPTLPSDLRWAIGEGEYISGGVGGGKSTVGSIIFADRPASSFPNEEQQNAGPGEYVPPQVPTPTIQGVASSEVYQTPEGVSKADVFITVSGMEGVEYEVVVTTS